MSAIRTRLNAALSDRYEIERELGQGGMATVYLARDLKHERRVALKVLKPELAAVVGAERFLAEIRTTANLQHPHILPLHDSGEADGLLFYVMPHVEGESLRERLDREHQLPVDEAMRIATNMAEALDYAHRHGVIHRDIKPANILLHDGKPVVSDFGIALAVSAGGAGRLTETGLSLGTPHYMSPEQATGDVSVGPATDVWALGCVLYEMLVGEPPYTGSTPQAVLGKIITAEPASASQQRRSVPPNVDAAIRKALEKVPADRFASAGELARGLEEEGFRHGAPIAGGVVAGSGPWNRLSIATTAIAVVASALAVWGALRRDGSTTTTAPVPFRTALTNFELFSSPRGGRRIAISPDGSRIALASSVNGVSRLFVRTAGQRGFSEVAGSEGAGFPGFSPDGRWLVFAAGGQVRRVDVSGGPVLPVAEGSHPHWGLPDMLVFVGPRGISRIAPPGGEAVVIVPDTLGAVHPFLLPDGRAAVFQRGTAAAGSLWLVEIESREVVDLGVVGANPRYVPEGYLVFGNESQVLMAVPFDLETHRVTGEPVTVLADVQVFEGGATQFDVSGTGTAVYALSSETTRFDRELVFVDLGGRESPSPLPAGGYATPRFSPSGRYVAYSNRGTIDGDRRIWVWDRESGANPPITEAGADRSFFSRDGRYVYFEYTDPGTRAPDLFRALADGSGEPELLLRRDGAQVPLSETPDGSKILFLERAAGRGDDLLIATLGPDGAIVTNYLVAPWNEGYGRISPDGRQVAYVSDESSVEEVYVRSFPEPLGQIRVSEGGGTDPAWAPEGSAVYYLDEGELWRADLGSGGVRQRRVLPRGSWATRPGGAPATNWDVHPDGQSFVFVRDPAGRSGPPPLEVEVVVNWFEELRQRVRN